jgi:hypothetical protein
MPREADRLAKIASAALSRYDFTANLPAHHGIRTQLAHMNFVSLSSRLALSLMVLSALVAAGDNRPARAQQAEPRIALVIGNGDYPDAEAPLKDVISNARALADELRRQGFDTDFGENLSKEATRAAVERFYGKIRSGSAALLFFSGFAIQSNRQTYIIPVNAQIWTEPDVRRDGYSLDAILAEMNSKGARVKIAIIDASRRNPFERRFRAVPLGLAPVIAPNNTAVMYAAAPSMVVRDSDRGSFVSELVKEIRAAGKIDEIFNRVARSVKEANSGQVPWFSSSLVEDYSFAPSSRPRPEPPASRPEQARKKQPEPSEAELRREYQRAERENTRVAYQDFLARHPAGSYSDLARERLKKLEPPPESARPRRQDPEIAELDRRIERNPNDAAAYYKRGQLYAQQGDFKNSIRDFDQALRFNPRDAEALNNRCWARAMVGELQLALKDCNEALQVRPSYVDALDSRGFVSLKLGQPNKAITDYDSALRINPKHASALYGRGIAKLRTGNTAGGNSDIAAAKSIQPDIADDFSSYGIR